MSFSARFAASANYATTPLSYKIIVDSDPEDGSYVVHCPALPGCYSQGDSREEAIQNITEAYVGSLRKDKLSIPRGVEPEIVDVSIRD